MEIKGKHIINATPKVVWKMILDPRVLEKITPGIKTLKEKETDVYQAVSEVKVGPVRGAFEGNLAIKDKVTEESCIVALDQKSKMGNAKAEISMKLIPTEDGETEIQYTGDVRMSGMLARMGQRIIGGVVSTLSKQFFTALENEIEN